MLPISIGLQVLATLFGNSPGDTLVPFWLLLVLVLGARWIGQRTRNQRAGRGLVVSLPLVLAVEVVGLAISPLAYGNEPGAPFSMLGALGGDLLVGSGRLNVVFWLTALLGYVWWRGLHGGRAEPTLDGLLKVFKFSMAGVVLGVIFGVVAQGFSQVELAGRLAVLLPLEVCVGLVTLALGRAVAQPVEGVVGRGEAADARPWVSFSLLLAGGVVGLALVLSLILSYNTLQAALLSLGPVGAALYAGISWLIYGLSYVLFFIFGGPINFLRGLAHKNTLHVPTPPPPPKNHCRTPNCLPTTVPPATGIILAVFLALVLIGVIALAAWFVYRTLRAVRVRSLPGDVWEAREALEGDPLGDLLARWRRRGPRRAADETPDGVRRVYREVLAAAAAAGVERRPSETPDEYEGRLGADLSPQPPPQRGEGGPDTRGAPSGSPHFVEEGAERAVAALTTAYDQVRYGEQEAPGTEQRRLRGQGEALVRRLRARPARGAKERRR